MSGELIVKNDGGFKIRMLSLGITAVVVLMLAAPVIRMLTQSGRTGLMTQIGMAILVPLVIWVLHPQMMSLFPGVQAIRRIPWTLTDTALLLEETEIPLKNIRTVYCWKRETSFSVNIETTGRNQLFHAVFSGEEQGASAKSLQALVDALSTCVPVREG